MNYFSDNNDIEFLMGFFDLKRLAALLEFNFALSEKYDFAPADAEEAIDNYRRVLELVGNLAAEKLAPTAEETDLVGNTLGADGTVTYAPGIAECLRLFSQAGLMGFTLPYEYGGLNMPTFVYTVSNELVSRADASFMNMYGLQGIAETINSFATEEIKKKYLPKLASGEFTGAMALTEPDAGSDLQSVKTRAFLDENGVWRVQGVKRFITNGCGDVLLTLARTEPEISDGRGLSCLLVEKSPEVRIRRLENKLGIHGSPTCEIVFDNAKAELIGQRQRGLITYVMALMNGARTGIAAQSLGIAEAAFRTAKEYAAVRKQFGATIDSFPAVRELLANMDNAIQAARALTYYSAFSVDMERGLDRQTDFFGKDAPEAAIWRKEARRYKSFNKLLTPLAKYFASETCMSVANSAVSVLGGSGYMNDYPSQRYLRDSRITTIYEGTSQLQIIAAIAQITGGVADELISDALKRVAAKSTLAEYVDKVDAARRLLEQTVAYVKNHPGGQRFRDASARRLTDMALITIVAALLLEQAAASRDKIPVLKHWIWLKFPDLDADNRRITQFEIE